MKEPIELIREMVSIQSSNGNWNYDEYMHGMANGLILALATMEGVTPKFLEAPKEWLRDRATDSTESTPASREGTNE